MKCLCLGTQLCLGLLMLAFPILSGFARDSAVHEVEMIKRVQIRLYNYAAADSRILIQAEKETFRVFSLAQIEIEWVDCLELMQQQPESSPCRNSSGPYELTLRLLEERGSEGVVFRDSHLGFALPAKNGGTYATIFFPDVVAMATLESVDQARLLGCAIAHEIGHLLLNRSDHAATGLMRGRWNSVDLANIARGQLLFNPKEVKSMATELKRRNSTAEPPPQPHVARVAPSLPRDPFPILSQKAHGNAPNVAGLR